MSNFVFLSWRFHSQYYYCKKKARKSFEKKTSLTLWESSISKKKLTYILKLMYCRLVWLNKKLIVIIYLSIRTFAIWILPHVVASWSGVEYLGKSIWLTSSPRLSLSKTSSRFPAIAASFRFFDIFLFFSRELVSCFKLRRFYYYKSDSYYNYLLDLWLFFLSFLDFSAC